MVKKPSRRNRLGVLHHLVRLIRLLARPNTYTAILFIMTLLLALGTVLIWFLERSTSENPSFPAIEDAFVFMLQNVSGVGLGAGFPHSAGQCAGDVCHRTA